MSTQFSRIDCARQNGVLVIRLNDANIQGDELADKLREELLEAVAHHDAGKLIIDFRNVKFMSSAGFRPLLSLRRKLQESRGHMVFCNLSPEIAEVFLVTRLISSNRSATAPFEMAGDVKEAMARLNHHTNRLEKGVLVLTLTENKLHGDDLADALTEELMAAVIEAKAGKVVLDLQHVKAITTPCIRPLLLVRNYLRNHGGRVLLCNLDPLVAEVLTVTRLISASGGPVPLEAAKDLPAALAALK